MISKIKILFLLLMASISPDIYSQGTGTAEPSSVWSNTLFVAMAVLSGVLLMVIIILATVLRTAVKTKVREILESRGIHFMIALLLVFNSGGLFAQVAEKGKGLYVDTPVSGMHPMAFYTLFAVLLMELFVILWLCLMILRMIIKREAIVAVSVKTEKKPSVFFAFFKKKVLGIRPVESDTDLLLDHNYDGIRELDNDLPPWWKYGFYFTIISGIIYLVGYHVTGTFKLSKEEYDTEMAEAEAQVNAYRTKMALNVDETNALFVSEVEKISKGKEIFTKNCIPCHNNEGQGNAIGPNLTDKYWLYGNKPGDLFKTVKNGTNKGMKSWKNELSPTDIQNVISFIHTLQGTKPKDPKEPQGELYDENASDSVLQASPADSAKVIEIKG